MNMKKTFATTAALLSLCAGSACWTEPAPAPWVPVAQAAEAPEWQDDIDKAAWDDEEAFNISIGKSMADSVALLQKDGWKRVQNEDTVFYIKKKIDYYLTIALHPDKSAPNKVGSYRIRVYAKTQELADEMYMRAEKNFSYNFGRPNVKKGTTNGTWFLSDTYAVTVEYNEYDARMPIVKDYYPYEVVIRRDVGDYKKFFQAIKK